MEEKNTTMGTTETMEDYKEALEASYRRIRPGDIVTGTVIDVNDQDVTIDFNYYAPSQFPVFRTRSTALSCSFSCSTAKISYTNEV